MNEAKKLLDIVAERNLTSKISDDLKLPKVGIFWFVDSAIISDTKTVTEADTYGDFKNYGEHYKFWETTVKRLLSKLRNTEYEDYPRGRVVYNYKEKKFIIYIDKKLDKDSYKKEIKNNFNITNYEQAFEFDSHYC